MWSHETRNATVAIVCATVATVAAFQAVNLLGQWRAQQHWRQAGTSNKPRRAVKTLSLCRFQSDDAHQHAWVALCGTVFDVAGDPFFDAATGGVYASWLRHDATALLLQGGVLDGSGRDASEHTLPLLDTDMPLHTVDSATDDLSARRRQILVEWYMRFASRYAVIGQISDLYAGAGWDSLREQMTPPQPSEDDNTMAKPMRRGKCPLGFGSSTVEQEEVDISQEDPSTLREIKFQGRRYDVRGSQLFQSPHGALAHFVGHDITYALAIQSNSLSDLDVVATREYSYEEQVRLEQFRRVFAKELRVITTSSSGPVLPMDTKPSPVAVVDLHQLIDADADSDIIHNVLASHTIESVNAVCLRTTMTPLHKAVEKNRRDLVELLLRAGAKVDAPAALYDDETALQMATRFGHQDIIQILSTV